MDKNVILNSHTQLLALKISGTQLVHLPTKQSTNNTLEYCIVSEFSWAELLSPSEDVLETDNIRLKGKDNQAQHYGFTLCWDLYSYLATGFYYLYIYIYSCSFLSDMWSVVFPGQWLVFSRTGLVLETNLDLKGAQWRYSWLCHLVEQVAIWIMFFFKENKHMLETDIDVTSLMWLMQNCVENWLIC